MSSAAAPEPLTSTSIDKRATLLGVLLAAPQSCQNIFSASFLRQVTIEQVVLLVTDLTSKAGSVQKIAFHGREGEVTCDLGKFDAFVEIDDRGKISGLSLGSFRRRCASLSESLDRILDRNGIVSCAIFINGCEVASYRADIPLMVASSAKLAILNAVWDAYTERPLNPTTVVSLEQRFKSIPSGILQRWPIGSQVTVDTLVNLMIGESDNTAADALLSLVGRQAVERYAGINVPFPSTRQVTVVRSGAGADLRRRWCEAEPQQRIELLKEIDELDIPAIGDIEDDISILGPDRGIEWRFSARALCSLLERVAHMDALSINTGIRQPEGIDRMCYKGGSDFGIANMTFHLAVGDNTAQIASTWNTDDIANFMPTQFFEDVEAAVRAAALELIGTSQRSTRAVC